MQVEFIREGKIIKFLFWNIYKKNLIAPIIQVITENKVDICAFAECDILDANSILFQLKNLGEDWKLIEIMPKGNLKLFSRQKINISVIKEEKHFSCYRVRNEEKTWLLNLVHLSSPYQTEEIARNMRAQNVSDVIRKIEEEVFGEDEFKSIIVGDFNLQPYSQGVAGVLGFNATMSVSNARRNYRKIDGEKRYFYFNPMWKLMGDNKLVQGTYYSDKDQQDLSMFWYSFDEVLIRPYFIEKFNWEYFDVIERTNDYTFIDRNKINKIVYSDHLPLKFEII